MTPRMFDDMSKDFAVRIVRLYKYLCENKKEFVMSKQLLKAGTSIGANIAEAEFAISKKDFIAKRSIALKECSETKYWLELLYKTNFISKNEFLSISKDCLELLKILAASTKTLKKNL